jgi:hypothetical protein
VTTCDATRDAGIRVSVTKNPNHLKGNDASDASDADFPTFTGAPPDEDAPIDEEKLRFFAEADEYHDSLFSAPRGRAVKRSEPNGLANGEVVRVKRQTQLW